MDQVQLTASFADTPKDGKWYQIPCPGVELTEYIRWDSLNAQWDWIMIKDMIAVIEASYIPEQAEF